MKPRSCTAAGLILTLTALVAAPAAAQVALGVRVGQGWGSANYQVVGLNGRLRLHERLYAMADLEISADTSLCALSYDCPYEGWAASAGPAVALIDNGPVLVVAHGTVGLFRRRDDEFAGPSKFASGVGVGGELRVWGRLGVQAAVTHRRMFDGRYRDLAGEWPHRTTLTVGVVARLGERNNGG